MASENPISERECDNKHDNLNVWIAKIEERMDKVENKFWWMICLLLSNLVGVLILLIKGGAR